MIDIATEDVISLTHATKELPERRGGKRPHVATLYRWAQRGCRGVRLETIQIGSTRCTSIQALQRFFDRLTGSGAPDNHSGGVVIAPNGSPRHSYSVDRQLESEGL